MSKKYFTQLADYMKINPGLSKKQAAAELKKVDHSQVQAKITCPGCVMSANVISDACGRCGMIFNQTELA